MIGARQRIGHMTVVGHPTNLDVWSVTIHSVLLVLQPTNHNAGIRPCGSWGNNNIMCKPYHDPAAKNVQSMLTLHPHC